MATSRPARWAAARTVMARVTEPKIWLLVRDGDRPAGCAFADIHAGIAMLHSVVIDPASRAELDKSGDVQTQMGSTDNAISYLDFSHFDDSKFNAIKVEGVEPKSANVTDDSFKIWATEHMYCAKDADEATKAFLDFMLSDDVQGELVEEQGFIPVSAMKVVKDASGKVSAK